MNAYDDLVLKLAKLHKYVTKTNEAAKTQDGYDRTYRILLRIEAIVERLK